MEAICSSETSVLTTVTRYRIPDDSILHSHRRGNFKCYIALPAGLCSGNVVFPVRYELGFYIPEYGIVHIFFFGVSRSGTDLQLLYASQPHNVLGNLYYLAPATPLL
jgi:hypothetical protein